MNKFEKQLEKWNNGVLRGAQAKLAKALGVSTATTALWATGKRHPSKGYVAQMASLFNLDTYSVLKLFEKQPSVIYPDPISFPTTYALRERADDGSYFASSVSETDNLYSQSNSVKIPFVRTLQNTFPYYQEEDVIEWWSIPRRYAQGARFLIASQYLAIEDAKSSDDLSLVKPCTELTDQAVMIFTNGKGKYIVRKIIHHAQALRYEAFPTRKIVTVSKQFYPIGQIVKRIKPL